MPETIAARLGRLEAARLAAVSEGNTMKATVMEAAQSYLRASTMPESPITFRAPPENAAAYRAAAEKAGIPLGRWINETLTAALSKSARKGLPEPREPGRPKKQETGE